MNSARLPKRAAFIVLAGACITLASAWIIQALGFEPCELCLKQRLPYYAALPIAGAAILLDHYRQTAFTKVLSALLAIIFFATAIFAAYHSGVEWKFWPGPSDCTGVLRPISFEAFHQQLHAIRIVRCDEPAFRILGLSLANLNVLISTGLSLIAMTGSVDLSKKSL